MGDQPDYERGQPKPIVNEGPALQELVAAEMLERRDYGIEKYGTYLQAGNGRNFLQDLYEEMQDGMFYLKGALVEQATTVRFVKFLLERQRVYHDMAFPDRVSEKVFRTEGIIPGWLKQACEEALGDRYEHVQENSPAENGGNFKRGQ